MKESLRSITGIQVAFILAAKSLFQRKSEV
jgi:hypothetical protein